MTKNDIKNKISTYQHEKLQEFVEGKSHATLNIVETINSIQDECGLTYDEITCYLNELKKDTG
jgi:hypothetical protein